VDVKRMAADCILEYSSFYPSKDGSCVKICQENEEPIEFIQSFHSWSWPKNSKKQWIPVDSLEDVNSLAEKFKFKYYSFSFLKESLSKDTLPEGVKRESILEHLESKDYKDAFGVSKEEFDKLASWKVIQLKKQSGLF
jgi:hypothetical protein